MQPPPLRLTLRIHHYDAKTPAASVVDALLKAQAEYEFQQFVENATYRDYCRGAAPRDAWEDAEERVEEAMRCLIKAHYASLPSSISTVHVDLDPDQKWKDFCVWARRNPNLRCDPERMWRAGQTDWINGSSRLAQVFGRKRQRRRIVMNVLSL